MILVDVNLLIHSHVEGMKDHARARAWFEARVGEGHRIGLPWAVLLGFVRIVSNPRIFEIPASVSRAWAEVERWLELECVWIPEPTERHREVLGRLLEDVGSDPKLVPDAHLAALSVEHGLTIASSDRDFGRFRGVRVENPLAT